MPLYRITTEKYAPWAMRYWTNRYIIDVPSWQDGIDLITPIANAERPLYTAASASITKGRLDDMIEGNQVHATVTLNLAGSRVAPASNLAPLWVTARVDFAPADWGRPSRKFIRGALYESDYDALSLDAAIKALLQTYANTIAGLAVVDPQGSNLVTGSVWNGPQERQLKRGSKRKPAP